MLELKFLGPVAARRDGTPLALRTRKAFALLAYLAAEGGTHRRAQLAVLLWPESDESKARTTLRSALSDLRGALGPDDETQAEYLLVDRDLLGLRSGADVDLDLSALENAYELARDSTGINPADHEQRRDHIERLRNGAEAYRGEFLQGFYLDDAPEFDYWATLERERWRTRLATVLDALSRILLDSGEAREAAAVADRWVAHDLPGELWRIEALTGAVQAELGDEAEAQSSQARAAAIVNRLADGIRDAALRRRYVSATAVHREPHPTPSP